MNYNLDEMKNKLNEMTLNKNEKYLIVERLSSEIELKLAEGFKLFKIYKTLNLDFSFNSFKKYFEIALEKNKNQNQITNDSIVENTVKQIPTLTEFRNALIDIAGKEKVENWFKYHSDLYQSVKQDLRNALDKLDPKFKNIEIKSYKMLLDASKD